MGDHDNDINVITKDLESAEIDSNFNQSVSMLSQMFPNISLRLIKNTIQESNGDFDMACDVLLNQTAIEPFVEEKQSIDQEQVEEWNLAVANQNNIVKNKNKLSLTEFPEEFKNEGLFLREMFPNIPPAEILRHLKQERDTSKVYDLLLNYDVINTKNKPVKTKLSLSEEVESANPTRTWDQLDDEISKICELTDTDKKIAKLYFYKTNSVALSVIDIIEIEQSPYRSKTLEAENNKDTIKITSSRVQSAARPTAKLERKDSSSPVSIPKYAEYQYDSNSKECLDLETFKLKEPEYFKISDHFFMKLMNYFEGNVDKVIHVATFIINENASESTYPGQRVKKQLKSLPLNTTKIGDRQETKSPTPKIVERHSSHQVNSSMSEADYLKKSEHYTKMARESSQVSIKEFYTTLASQNRTNAFEARNNLQRQVKTKKIQQSVSTNTLDLHNLSVDVALETASSVLTDWWNEERERREISGKFQKYGKVQEVDELTIITGRGIHSKSGVSKVKVSVKKLLNSQGYIFDEGSSTFIIIGKKAL